MNSTQRLGALEELLSLMSEFFPALNPVNVAILQYNILKVKMEADEFDVGGFEAFVSLPQVSMSTSLFDKGDSSAGFKTNPLQFRESVFSNSLELSFVETRFQPEHFIAKFVTGLLKSSTGRSQVELSFVNNWFIIEECSIELG